MSSSDDIECSGGSHCSSSSSSSSSSSDEYDPKKKYRDHSSVGTIASVELQPGALKMCGNFITPQQFIELFDEKELKFIFEQFPERKTFRLGEFFINIALDSSISTVEEFVARAPPIFFGYLFYRTQYYSRTDARLLGQGIRAHFGESSKLIYNTRIAYDAIHYKK